MSKISVFRNPQTLLFLTGFLVFFGIIASVSQWPLQGIHSHRQADTLFAAYSYCYEQTPFLTPKIAHRADTSGISIGEFPLFSYLLSLPCKATGQWFEALFPFISLLVALLCTAAWGLLLKRKFFPKTDHFHAIWAGVFFFIIGHLIHLNIPMPDAFALLIIAIAGLVDQPTIKKRAISYALFALAFTIRPYFFLLSFLIYENLFVAVGALAICGGPYLVWYKNWIRQSEIDYYATEVKSFSDLIKELPRALSNAPAIFIRNHLNFVLIIPFVRGLLKRKKWALICLLGWIAVIILKGDHYVNHSYYLGAASLFAAAIIVAGLVDLKQWQQCTLIGISILIGLANSQHLWTDTKENHFYRVQEALQKSQVPPDARIVAYVDQSPQFLYWAKKTGWLLSPAEAQDKCPSSTVQFKLYVVGERDVRIEPCL